MKLRRWAYALTLTILLIVSLAGFKVWEIKSAIAYVESFPEHSETVTVTKIQQHERQNKMSVMGTIVSPQRVMLRSESAGRITQLAVAPNQQVFAGQLLVQLDVSSELAQIQAAKARRLLAKLEVNRFVKLHQKQSVSQSLLDTARADLAIVDAELAELDSAIARKTVRAPFDGVMGLHNLALGLFLDPGSEIGELVGQQSYTWVEFSVPQFYPALRMNDEMTVLPIQQGNTEQLHNNSGFTAIIIARDPGLSATTRSVLYRAKIELPKDKHGIYLAHNMAVKVQVPIGLKQVEFKVPASSVQFDRQSAFVYLLNTDSKDDYGYRTERRDIIMLERLEDYIILAAKPSVNLQEKTIDFIGGELVAAQGAFKLQPNMLVYPSEPLNVYTEELTVSKCFSLSENTSELEG